MCSLSESSSTCPRPAYVTFQQRQWLSGFWLFEVIVVGDVLNQKPTTSMSLWNRLFPFWTNHFKSFSYPFPFENAFFLFHSLGVKSILAIAPPRLIWMMFFPVSQPENQLKEILTNHSTRGVISSLNALPGLDPLCELPSFASPWEAGCKHIWCVFSFRRPS